MNSYSLVPLPPNVTPDMLEAGFWLDRMADTTTPLLSPEAILDFNACVHTTLNIPDVLDLADTLSAQEVREQIARYQPSNKPRYGSAGQQLDAAYFQALVNKGAPALPDPVPVRFGLSTHWANVRSFPTDEVITAEPFQFEFDRIQETSIDVGWPVAVVATSQDGQWFFCLTPLYWGWVHAEYIALGTREQVAGFVHADPFLITTASRGMVALATGGSVTPQMGTRLPLHEDKPHAYRVGVPNRKLDGTLRLSEGFVAKRASQFAREYLPCTWQTIYRQAFSLLGEPYAWGDSRMGIFGRDCSRFIRDIHAVTGINLPRNADQQEKTCAPIVTFPADMAGPERKKTLVEQARPGAILAMPGHIMLYAGQVNGEPFVIHDTSSNGYSSVIVSDLSLGANSPSGSLLQRLTTAVMIG